MPDKPPRLDRNSLAQLGRELQAAHYMSEKEPLSDRQKDLLLEWAVMEAMEAAQHGVLPTQTRSEREGVLLPLQPPEVPQPIETAPKAMDANDWPVVLLLYSPEHGGWHTGFWSAGRWRTHLSPEVDLQPTHWLPRMLPPEGAAPPASANEPW